MAFKRFETTSARGAFHSGKPRAKIVKNELRLNWTAGERIGLKQIGFLFIWWDDDTGSIGLHPAPNRQGLKVYHSNHAGCLTAQRFFTAYGLKDGQEYDVTFDPNSEPSIVLSPAAS